MWLQIANLMYHPLEGVYVPVRIRAPPDMSQPLVRFFTPNFSDMQILYSLQGILNVLKRNYRTGDLEGTSSADLDSFVQFLVRHVFPGYYSNNILRLANKLIIDR